MIQEDPMLQHLELNWINYAPKYEEFTLRELHAEWGKFPFSVDDLEQKVKTSLPQERLQILVEGDFPALNHAVESDQFFLFQLGMGWNCDVSSFKLEKATGEISYISEWEGFIINEPFESKKGKFSLLRKDIRAMILGHDLTPIWEFEYYLGVGDKVILKGGQHGLFDIDTLQFRPTPEGVEIIMSPNDKIYLARYRKRLAWEYALMDGESCQILPYSQFNLNQDTLLESWSLLYTGPEGHLIWTLEENRLQRYLVLNSHGFFEVNPGWTNKVRNGIYRAKNSSVPCFHTESGFIDWQKLIATNHDLSSQEFAALVTPIRKP